MIYIEKSQSKKKNNMKELILILILFLIVPANMSFTEQSSHILESGITLVVSNDLPETIHHYFKAEILANKLSRRENLLANFTKQMSIEARVYLDQKGTLVMKIRVNNFISSALDLRIRNYGNSYMFWFSGPSTLLNVLYEWYINVLRDHENVPYDIRMELSRIDFRVGCYLMKTESDTVAFFGTPARKGLYIQMEPSIFIQGINGAEEKVTALKVEPLGTYYFENPIDPITKQKRPSFLLFSFFDRLDLIPDKLDRALAERQVDDSNSSEPTAEIPTGESRPVDGESARQSADPDESGFVIEWEDPAAGREAVTMVLPRIPQWVSEQGLQLKVVVAFVLTPQGILSAVELEKSSGYSDVDSAVLEAVRKWKFKAVRSNRLVRGRLPYRIIPN